MSFIIVALGNSSVMMVNVVQKGREIGILRAMGAGRRRAGRLAVWLGAGLQPAGGVLAHLQKLRRQPAVCRAPGPRLVVLACGVGLAAAVIPARSAARMDSVQAIRS